MTTFTPGLHYGIPMADYQQIDAIGSGRIEALATSPLHYRYRLEHPEPETDATRLGTALHTAVLEPDLFERVYAAEPDTEQIGGAKPRATSAYKDAVRAIEESGRRVLRTEAMESVLGMAVAVRNHPHAKALLQKATEREVTVLWKYGERRCRARVDLLGEGAVGDLKTTRSLKDFSPWTIWRMGYFRQAGHYVNGLLAAESAVDRFFFVVVESSPPFDVGVFVLEQGALEFGMTQSLALLDRLDECERTNTWPGMFPAVQEATLPDSKIEELVASEEAIA